MENLTRLILSIVRFIAMTSMPFVFILAIIGAIHVQNLVYCGLETCPLFMDRQTVLMLRDQRYLVEDYNAKFPPKDIAAKEPKKKDSKS